MKALKFLIIFFLALGVFGCTGGQDRKKYLSLYYEEIYKSNYKSTVKQSTPEAVRREVKRQLDAAGYKKVIYSDAKYDFTVVGKQATVYYASILGNNYPYRIIYKLNQEAPYRTRVYLARVSNIPEVNQQVDWDIQKISRLIKGSK